MAPEIARAMQAAILLGALVLPAHSFRSFPASPKHIPSHKMTMLETSPRVAVVGAGWGGWAAAKALCENGCKVTLLDGLPDPSGSTPYLTPTGKPFEAGQRGFWKDYPNIESLIEELGMQESEVLTPFTESAFYSPDGLEATAPVFGDSFELPSPLGQVFATFSNFKRLPLQDRASMAGLLYAMLDFSRDEETFKAYDRMTAHELFIRMGLSQRLVDDFIRPTLLVGLFKPPEELSAAVAMELLYYYALAHQTSFDVRWLKRGTVAESFFKPLYASLQEKYDIELLGGSFVSEVVLDDAGSAVTAVRYKDRSTGQTETLSGLDGCVLALGAKGMRAVMSGSKQLAAVSPELCGAASLATIDVISVRLWLDGIVPTQTPANVLSRYPALRGAGGTFFMLDQLQDQEELWAGESVQGSVVSCDFYNSGSLMPLSDSDIVSLLIDQLLPDAVSAFRATNVVDSYVQRFPGAVSWFSPGSYVNRPPLEIPAVSNLVCAGDWVKMGDREHGAKGLCQERAYVSGLEAANSLARRGKLQGVSKEHEVLKVREDETQYVVGSRVNKAVMDVMGRVGLASPWVR